MKAETLRQIIAQVFWISFGIIMGCQFGDLIIETARDFLWISFSLALLLDAVRRGIIRSGNEKST